MKKNQALEYKNQGNEYYKKGEYENALLMYGKAIEIDPEYRDAWNNLYITLLKQDREDDAKKCKEILDKLASEPEDLVKVKREKSSSIKKLFAALLIIIVLIVISVSLLAIYGWVISHGTSTGSPEHVLNSLVIQGPSGISSIVNNASATGNTIPSSGNVAVTASRIGGTISVRNYGGPDIGDVSSFTVLVDGVATDSKLGTGTGSSIIVNPPGSKNHVIVTAKFTDGQERVVLDTTV